MVYSEYELKDFFITLNYDLLRITDDSSSAYSMPLSYEKAIERIKYEDPVYTAIIVDGIRFPIKAVLLFNVFQYKQIGKETKNEMIARDFLDIIDNIRKLVHVIPFKQMPLYINNYPDIVSWRLRIGK